MDCHPLKQFVSDTLAAGCTGCRFYQKAIGLGVFCSNELTTEHFEDWSFTHNGRKLSKLPQVVDECRFFQPRWCRRSYPIAVLMILREVQDNDTAIKKLAEELADWNIDKEKYEEYIRELTASVSKENWDLLEKIDDIVIALEKKGVKKRRVMTS